MISEKKRLEIANICYANVSGMFATFMNPINVGPNFKWSNFISMMERQSPEWMYINSSYNEKTKQQIIALAKQYATEIASTLLDHAGVLNEVKIQ